MAMDERSRYALHQKLEQLLGTDEAGTLMEHLPPVGWGDLATKQDLSSEVGGLRRDLKASETYVIGTLRSEIAQAISLQTRTIVLTNLRGMLGVAALVLAATRL
jgi:hypothetical protein